MITVSYYLVKQEAVNIEVLDTVGKHEEEVVGANDIQGLGSGTFSLVPEKLNANRGIYPLRFIHIDPESKIREIIADMITMMQRYLAK